MQKCKYQSINKITETKETYYTYVQGHEKILKLEEGRSRRVYHIFN